VRDPNPWLKQTTASLTYLSVKKICLLCLACLGLCLTAQALSQGMTTTAVKAELGQPISSMEMDDRTIWIYADARKLEFESGKLVRENGLTLQAATSDKAAPQGLLSDSRSTELEIKIPIARDNMTITESIESEELTAENLSEVYNFSAINKDLGSAIENYENTHNTPATDKARNHLRDVLIGFILELVLTCIVLKVAFNLSGAPCLFHQIALLSLAVALVGATLEYLLSIGLFNPIRIGLSFIILLTLIRQMTDVRDWATAIRITITARLISIALMWLSFAGLMVLFSL